MTKMQFHPIEIFTMLVILFGITGFTFYLFPEMKSSDVSAWVQGVGSLGAILAAIWVFQRQQKNDIERAHKQEKNDIKNLLRGLRDEVTVVTEQFEKRNGKLLMEGAADRAFPYRIPVGDNTFPIYESAVDHLGKISNDELRQKIIIGYGRTRGFIQSLKMNNQIIERLEKAEYNFNVHKDEIHAMYLDQYLKSAQDYGNLLREIYIEALQSFKELATSLQNEIDTIY